jgi:hypothetical protein
MHVVGIKKCLTRVQGKTASWNNFLANDWSQLLCTVLPSNGGFWGSSLGVLAITNSLHYSGIPDEISKMSLVRFTYIRVVMNLRTYGAVPPALLCVCLCGDVVARHKGSFTFTFVSYCESCCIAQKAPKLVVFRPQAGSTLRDVCLAMWRAAYLMCHRNAISRMQVILRCCCYHPDDPPLLLLSPT